MPRGFTNHLTRLALIVLLTGFAAVRCLCANEVRGKPTAGADQLGMRRGSGTGNEDPGEPSTEVSAAENRLATDFTVLAGEQPEPAEEPEIMPKLPGNAPTENDKQTVDVLFPKRDGPGFGLDDRKWFTDWHGQVFMGVGTHDTWHTGFSVHGYVIPDRVSLGISTCVGKYPSWHGGWWEYDE